MERLVLDGEIFRWSCGGDGEFGVIRGEKGLEEYHFWKGKTRGHDKERLMQFSVG